MKATVSQAIALWHLHNIFNKVVIAVLTAVFVIGMVVLFLPIW